jgi:tripartite-type tricarboxylate transporter receptor subunit TctC
MRERRGAWVGAALLLVFSSAGCRSEARSGSGAALGGGSCASLAGETIRWIVPSTPGGGYDVYSRMIEPFLERATGAEVAVENRAGAGGRMAFRAVLSAEPNGLTLGIVNGTGLLMRDLMGEDTPHPFRDFTVLGRITSGAPVLFTRADSPVRTERELLDAGDGEPMVFGVANIASVGWVWTVIARELLDLNTTYIDGYPGTRETSMALIRGDVDFAAYTFDSVRDRMDAGAIRPLMVLSAQGQSNAPSLVDVPSLAGPDGAAARRAVELGRDPAEAAAQADAWVQIYEIGRLVVAPPDMPTDRAACLEAVIADVLQDPEFVAVAETARRKLDYGSTDALLRRLEASGPALDLLAAQLQSALERR